MSDWYERLHLASSRLVQHTLSGPVVIGGVERTDLHAVRAEDWDALHALLEPDPRATRLIEPAEAAESDARTDA